MKKLFTLLVISLLSLCLFGCSSGSNSTSLDMDKAASELDSAMGNMADLAESELSITYGLDTSKMEKYIIKSSTLADGNFYALIQVSSDNKNDVKDMMSNMFAVMEKQSELYSPEAVTMIKNRLETSVGDYLIYIVGEDTNALYDIVKACVK